MNKIAVLGANGQIGGALVHLLGNRAIPFTRADADLAQPDHVIAALEKAKPDAVINAAAYTQVDKAETESEAAFLINATAPGIIAGWCAENKIPFIHYSTDYVMDGTGNKPFIEDSPTAPLNKYGESKLAGEQAITEAGGQYLIFRTSWVYDAEGKNFLNTMLQLGSNREELRVIDDQFGAPCYAPHLAAATITCLEKATAMPVFPSGIYHFTCSGETSWHGFASAIFAAAKAAGAPLKIHSLHAIPSSEYPLPAKRPHNSRLDNSKLKRIFGISLPEWQAGLTEAIEWLFHKEDPQKLCK